MNTTIPTFRDWLVDSAPNELYNEPLAHLLRKDARAGKMPDNADSSLAEVIEWIDGIGNGRKRRLEELKESSKLYFREAVRLLILEGSSDSWKDESLSFNPIFPPERFIWSKSPWLVPGDQNRLHSFGYAVFVDNPRGRSWSFFRSKEKAIVTSGLLRYSIGRHTSGVRHALLPNGILLDDLVAVFSAVELASEYGDRADASREIASDWDEARVATECPRRG